MRTSVLVAALAAAFLALPANALYIETPLRLHGDRGEADVGDDVTFTVSTDNETARQEWAGRTVVARYGWDRAEGTGGGEDDADWQERDLASVTLDEKAAAEFTWTVPEEVDDRNVVVSLHADDGTQLAFADLRVGDAEGIARIAAGSGGGEPAPVDDGADEPAPADDEPARDTPAVGAALAALGAAAAARVARRKL